MRAACTLVYIGCAVGAMAQRPAEPPEFATYANARFGFAVSYPKSLLPQGESTNGDGQAFESKDKTFKLLVWGQHNALDHTVAEEYEFRMMSPRKKDLKVTYKVVKPGWFVYSGVANGVIVYEKTILVEGVFKTVYLEYPLRMKDALNGVVNKIIASFTG
jgi:hypothetical protein